MAVRLTDEFPKDGPPLPELMDQVEPVDKRLSAAQQVALFQARKARKQRLGVLPAPPATSP